MNEELRQRVESYRADFERVRGFPFRYFHCPILQTDLDVELCKGHIINEASGGSRWVPQVKAVDNFYGSVAEADMVAVLKDRHSDPAQIWLDPEMNRRHKPRLECNGKPIEHYFLPLGKESTVSGHSTGVIYDSSNNPIRTVVFKTSSDELADFAKDTLDINIVIERDYRPHVIASIIKAAHLTLFGMFGYSHVFSAPGIFLSSILREFYLANHRYKKRDLTQAAERYFLEWSNIGMPLVIKNPEIIKGTATDNRVLFCESSRGQFFCIAVVVQVENDQFCVFTPGDDRAIDTYISFLKEPPVSVSVRHARFCPGTEIGTGHWEVAEKPVQRVQMPHAGELPEWAEERFAWKK